MDFVEGLPVSEGYSVILVVVDRQTKYAHFLPVKHPFTAHSIAKTVLDNVIKLHGFPHTIVTDRDKIFLCIFWKELFKLHDTQLLMSSAYHPQMDGQKERTNQVLEDMLRACALKHGGSWDKSLPYAEFSYNNSYQASLKMAPFEALYGRKCRTPLYWSETGESQLFGPEIIKEAERQVQIVRENLKVAQSR